MLIERTHNQTRQNSFMPFRPVSQGVLQRQCACGTHTMDGGECAECQKKNMGVGGQPLQTKLVINKPGDAYEQEADRVAEQVMRMSPAGVNRKQSGRMAQTIVQRRATGSATGVAEAPPSVHEVLNSPGQPLDTSTRAFFEPRFGHDFSQVWVHTDAKAAEAARSVNAEAYTVGQDLVFQAGRYTPHSQTGKMLLAHELAHSVQNGGANRLFRQPAQAKSKPKDKINYKKARKENKKLAEGDFLGWKTKLNTVANGKFKGWADLWNKADYDGFADAVAQFQEDEGFKGVAVDGILGLKSWARIGGMGEAMGGIREVHGDRCQDVCTLATKERIERGYKLAHGKRFTLPEDKDAKLFNVILQTIEGRMLDVDQQYRGTGAAGAMVYAGLGTFVSESDIWTGGLRTGAALQVWRDQKGYDLLQMGEITDNGKKRRLQSSDGNFYGTSAVFVQYDSVSNPTKMLVRHFGRSESWEKKDWAVWVAANIA